MGYEAVYLSSKKIRRYYADLQTLIQISPSTIQLQDDIQGSKQ